jgi:hypothetical protein
MNAGRQVGRPAIWTGTPATVTPKPGATAHAVLNVHNAGALCAKPQTSTYLHQYLVAGGHRPVDVCKLQDIGGAVPVLDDGLHRALPARDGPVPVAGHDGGHRSGRRCIRCIHVGALSSIREVDPPQGRASRSPGAAHHS